MANNEKLIFPIGFDLEEGVAQVEKDWGKMQKKLQDTFKSQTIQVDADISKAVLDKLYAKFEGLIKTMESKAPQIKLKIPDTVDFEQEINRLKVQLKSINLGELTDAESKDLYLYIRQLEALAKALKEVNKQEQLRQANRPEVIALKQAQAEEKRTRSLANSALAEQRRAKIATESARQDEINNRKKMRASVEQARIDEINNRSAQRGAVIAEQRRAATARAENAELRLTRAKERSTQATHEQNAAYKTQSGYLQRLFQRMVAYASVAQAFSFVRNIRDVTAEFELQRVALGALIQDAQKAEMIFEQIKVAAVESPYEVKDLVTYTKQLAAYSVKADDLIGTMNQLADISAGLGTDMDRIILAYGQIQAAGVLKGTELRQLTELGLPMVELLADYYSTLRNEVVTTSEVFDMISNKEIPFEAVQDILKDLTSEGGRFFDMQSKQAETLQGQWSNMKDTLSIMFDEMGRSEEVRTLLNNLIDGTKWLAENWRLIWQQVKIAAFTFGSLKASIAILNAITVTTRAAQMASKRYAASLEMLAVAQNSNIASQKLHARYTLLVAKLQNTATTSTNILIRSFARLGAVILANPIAAIMSLVGTLSYFVIKNKAAEASIESLDDKLRSYTEDAVANVEVQVASFKRLAKEVVEYTDGSERQQSALRKLKDKFGDMIPEYQLTAEYLRKVSDEANGSADAFDNMARSLRNVANMRIRDKLIENVNQDLEEQFTKLYDMASGGGFTFVEDLAKMQKEVLDGKYWESVYLEWREGMLDMRAKVDKDLQDKLSKGIRKWFYLDKSYTWKDILKALNERDINYSDYENLLANIIGHEGVSNINALYEYLEALGTAEKRINKIVGHFDGFNAEFVKVNNSINEASRKLQDLDKIGGDTAEKQAKNYAKKSLEIEKDLVKQLYDSLGEVQNKLPESDFVQQWAEGALSLDDLLGEYKDGKVLDIEMPDEFIYGLEEAKKLFGEFDADWKKFIGEQMTFVKNRKVMAFDKMQIQNFKSLKEALEQTSEEYDNLSKELEKYKKIQKTMSSWDVRTRFQNRHAVVEVNNKVEELEARNGLLKAIMDMYGVIEKSDERRDPTKERISLLKEEMSTVEKIYKEYQSLRKYMSVSDAQATINQMFGNVPFKILGMATSFEEMREQLNKALKEAKRLGDTKLVMDIEYTLGKLDVDESKQKMERDMRKLSDELSRTKTAKEFFDRMLGMTGDRELSATLTMSVYGTTGDDLQKLMTQEIIAAFKGVDISEAMLGGNKWDYNVLEGFVEQLPEEQRKNAQSIVDNWRKANADILTDLQKSYEDFMTYEERKTRVAEKYVAERKKIEESQYTKDEKDKLLRASREAEKKELGAIAIEEFKASEDWAKSFEDLENLATPTIERLMTELKEFIDLNNEAFTTEQLKTLTQEYQKLYDGFIQRNPFKAISDSVKEYRLAIANIRDIKNQLDFARELGDEELIANIERDLTDAFDEAQKASTKLKNGVDAVGDQFSQAASDIQFFANALGFSEDSYATQFLNGMANAFKGVSIAIGFADIAMKIFDGTIKSMLASNPIGWILLAVSAIISVVQTIMNARINRINKEIESLDDKLDNLKYAYDQLQKSAEKAFGTEYIQNYQRQLANLEAQVEAYEKQLSLERSKGKKADEEKIKDYQNQIRDTKDAIEDMYGSLSEHFLGTDLTSAARDFASAWIEAYKSFSNTTDAMKEKFQEMIQNMIVESLIAKVMERALKPVFDMVDNMGDSDFYSNSFWSQLMTEMNKATENGVVGAERIMQMFEQMGINLRDAGTGLTGISRDIATASEESILGLAAGINTQNFYISQVPTKLDTIIGLLRGGSAVVDSGVNVQDLITIQNQFLSHLPTIAQHTAETVTECKAIVVETRRTADALERVIKPDGTRTTYKMNVVTSYQG